MKLYFYSMSCGVYDAEKRDFERNFTAREAEARETPKLYIALDKGGFPFTSLSRLPKDKTDTGKVEGYGYLAYTKPSEADAREAFRRDYLRRAELAENRAREMSQHAENLRYYAAKL